MKRKYGNKFLNKKSFSLVVACSLLASFAGISIASFSNVHSTKKVSTSLKDSNSTQQQSVTDDITSFNSYDILASTNTIAPVISADGVVGWTSNHKTLTLTTYDGVLVWKLTFANNEDITSFYKTNYSSQTISEIQINNYVYLPSENILVVLLGSSSNTNQVVVGINMSTGTLFNPTPSSDGSINYIVKVKDGINRLFVNSSNNIIGIKDGNYSAYVNGEYLTFSSAKGVSELPLTIPKNLSKNESDNFYSYTTGSNGINFVTFTSNSATTPSIKAASSTYYTFYTVVVDDYMKPIMNSSTLVSTDVGYATNISNTNSSINNDDFWGYSTQTLSSDASSIKFFLVLGGGKSSILTFNYNISSKSLTKEKSFECTEGEQAFGMFLYNSSTKRIFISNKKSKNHVATGYVDLNTSDSSLSFVNLEYSQDSNWSSSTYIYTNLIREFPIISNQTLTVPDPYIVLQNNQTPIAKYFINNTDIQTYTLTFKYYGDPATKFKTNFSAAMKNLPSQVTDGNLISSLSFTGNNFSPTITVSNKSANDTNGILTFQYKVSYKNWYATSSTYTFSIATTISGFYAKSSFNFKFITGLTGDTTENNKWNQIVSLKSTKYAYQITANDIISNFISYDIKTNAGASVTISNSMISLSPSASGYSLTVTVNVSGSFPSGVTTTFSQTYDGFKTISGYDYHFVNNPNNFDNSLIYPSELTKADFLEYFVSLGDKWSANPNDYNFEITPDNLNGTAVVSLTYTSNDSSFPTGTSKEIVKKQTISSFKNIPSQFKTNISLIDYTGSLSPSELWKEYKENPADSKLLNYLNFPNVNNKTNLNITCSNESTCDQDGTLNLNISIKENTKTSLFIPGQGYFTYDSTAATAFKSILGHDSFSATWKINKANYNFEWIGSNGQVVNTNSSTFVVNLDNQSYDGINKNMYANQVSEESVDKLFIFDGYSIVNKSIDANPSQGTLTVVISIKPSDSIDSSIGVTETKTIIISGFKVKTMDSTKYILYTFLAIIALTTICLFGFLFAFIVKKRSKYNLTKKVKRIKK